MTGPRGSGRTTDALAVSQRGGDAAPSSAAEAAAPAETHGSDFVSDGDAPVLLRKFDATPALGADRTDLGPVVTTPVTRHRAGTAGAVATLQQLADGVGLGGRLTPALFERQLDHVRSGASASGGNLTDMHGWITARTNEDEDGVSALEDTRGLASPANHAMRYPVADTDVPECVHDRLRGYQRRYRPQEHAIHGQNVDLLDRPGLTDFVADRYASVGEPADRAGTLPAVRDVDGVDGVSPPTPMERTRAVLEGFAEDHGLRVYCGLAPIVSPGRE